MQGQDFETDPGMFVSWAHAEDILIPQASKLSRDHTSDSSSRPGKLKRHFSVSRLSTNRPACPLSAIKRELDSVVRVARKVTRSHVPPPRSQTNRRLISLVLHNNPNCSLIQYVEVSILRSRCCRGPRHPRSYKISSRLAPSRESLEKRTSRRVTRA